MKYSSFRRMFQKDGSINAEKCPPPFFFGFHDRTNVDFGQVGRKKESRFSVYFYGIDFKKWFCPIKQVQVACICFAFVTFLSKSSALSKPLTHMCACICLTLEKTQF